MTIHKFFDKASKLQVIAFLLDKLGPFATESDASKAFDLLLERGLMQHYRGVASCGIGEAYSLRLSSWEWVSVTQEIFGK